MLFTKSAVLFSVLALCNVVVAAQPPACLLSAVGSQPNPADLKTICVKNGDKMQDLISEKCDDDDKKDALSHFSSTCSSNGYKVDISSSTTISGSTATATTTGSQSAKTGFTTATASSDSTSSSSSSSGSTSSSPSASSTVSAGASDRHVSAAAFAAVVFVGFAATM